MSGNGRGNMRPTSRSPPFLVIGLLIALCILAFNYWNLSSKNVELSDQLSHLQVDFRSVSDKHLTVEKHASELGSQTADLRSKVIELQSSAAEKDFKITHLTGELESLRIQLEHVNRNLMETQSEMEHIRDEKNAASEELVHLKEQLEEEQERPVVCDKKMCLDVLRDVVRVMLDSVGKTAVISALSAQHADVLRASQDLLDGAIDPPVQQPQGNQQVIAQGEVHQQQMDGQAGLSVQAQAPGEVHQQQMDGQAGLSVQAQAPGQDLKMGANPKVGQAPTVEQPRNMDQNPNMGQTGYEAQGSNMGQGTNVGQGLNMGQNPNVVQMQQQAVAGQEGEKGNGSPSQQQSLGVLNQQPQIADSSNLQRVGPGLPQAQGGTLQGQVEFKQEERGGEQEIVAQNIPQRVEEEMAVSDNDDTHHRHDLNAPLAQEDVDDTQKDLLDEDEIDRQAAANQGAGGQENLDDNLHDQLQDLSKNDNKIGLEVNENKENMDGQEREEDQGDVDRDVNELQDLRKDKKENDNRDNLDEEIDMLDKDEEFDEQDQEDQRL